MSEAEKGYVTENDDGTKTLTLEYPFEYGTETITQLTFGRPKGKHIKGNGNDLDFAAKLAGVAPQVMDQMDLWDIERMNEVIQGFLPPGLRTGG